jgi:ankyrin repeat protein
VQNSCSLTQLFIEARADLNQLDSQYKQPLHLAIEEKLPDIVDLLLAAKANVNDGNIDLGLNSYPLVDAAHRGDAQLAKKLIAARSDINRLGKTGMSPLHLAARGKRKEVIQGLVEAKADVNLKATNGKTPGELAATNGSAELACLLTSSVSDGGYGQMTKGKVDDTKVTELDAAMRKQLFID